MTPEVAVIYVCYLTSLYLLAVMTFVIKYDLNNYTGNQASLHLCTCICDNKDIEFVTKSYCQHPIVVH